MRHLISLVLGVILAPVIYILAGIASIKEVDHLLHGAGTTTVLIAIACTLAAGALVAILALVRLSPVGPVLAGLVLFGISGWAALDFARFSDAFPTRFLGMDGVLQAGAGLGLMIAAVPLVATVFSPRRWRSSAQASAAEVFDASPVYGTTQSASPVYQPAGSYTTPAYSPSTPTPSSYTPPSYSTYSPSDTTITSPTYGNDGS